MRRTFAVKQMVPHFHLSTECRIDALLELRSELDTALAERKVRLSINDLLVKALARALGEVPEANVRFAGDAMIQFDRVDVAVAVAIGGDLMTPVLIDAGTKNLSTIARETQTLTARAREGKLTPEERTGGTVSIVNFGMSGIDQIFPILNSPQAMVLGVGAVRQRGFPVEGRLAGATTITLTTSFDHRVIDGSVGALVLETIRSIVEAPLLLLAW